MPITVYNISGAPRGWRVLVGLELKGLDYKVQHLSASDGEHKQPAFLNINPRGTVPALTTETITLCDSIAILAWLDREYPHNLLFGETPQEAAEIWQLTLDCCDYLRAAMHKIMWPYLILNADLPQEQSPEFNALQTAGKTLIAEYQRLDRLLDGRQYFCAERATAAEAIIYPEFKQLLRAVDRRNDVMAAIGILPVTEQFPRLAAWCERVSGLKGISKTQPYHW